MWLMRFHPFGIGILFLALVCPLSSQTPLAPAIEDPGFDSLHTVNRPVETIDVHVHEVNLVLSVTDHRGKFVNSLRPSDFTILDNGVEQTKLAFFKRETDLPIKIALVLDISGSVAFQFDEEKKAIKSFLKAVARPSDSVMLFAFNQNVQLKSPITNNWDETARRVKGLDPYGQTALYDAVSDASGWLALDSGPARRIMILISDGEENKSKNTIETTISDALNAEAAIYSVDVGNEDDSDIAKQGAAILKHLAEATGGAYIGYPKNDTLADAFDKIRRELRSQYALAYKLSNPRVRTFHRLQVFVAKRWRVHCRSGYYVR
jgi:Ca-activated chloride channel family protein